MTARAPMTDPRAPLPEIERPRGVRERLEALRYLPQLVRLVWQTHRGYTATMVVLRLVRAFVPVATLWVAKLIIDQVVLLTRAPGTPLTDLWRVVALELGIVVAGELLARASALVESLLGDLFSNHISVRLMRHAATLDLQQFEDPDFYDHLERARRQTTARIGLIAMLLAMGQDLITLATLGAALVVHNPWLLLLLTVAILPSFLGETHFAALSYSLLFRRTPERRELDYLRYVGASDKTAKEVQMFGLAGWLTDRYAALAQRYYEENRKLSIRKGIVSALLSFVGTLGYYGAYVTILLRAVAGAITLGTLGAALVVHNPWLLLLLTLAILPSFLGETHFAALSYSLLFRRTPERRELDYLRYVGASDKTAKEVQMFGLAGWLTDRYAALAQRYYEENRQLSIRKGLVSALLSLVGTLGYYGAYVTILLRAVAGAITLGTLTFLAAAFARSRDLIQRLLLSASDIYEQSLYLRISSSSSR